MKNYTSEVPPAKSIAKIEELLIQGGARQISKEYGPGGDVEAIAFSIVNPETKVPIYIRLPASPDKVFEVFKAERTRSLTRAQAENLRDQAKRTAWRLVWDWVAVQLSLIEMHQADLMQVFLPYIIVAANNTTFYQQLQANRVGMLGYSPKEETADAEAINA